LLFQIYYFVDEVIRQLADPDISTTCFWI
jgi:hypothetical protein